MAKVNFVSEVLSEPQNFRYSPHNNPTDQTMFTDKTNQKVRCVVAYGPVLFHDVTAHTHAQNCVFDMVPYFHSPRLDSLWKERIEQDRATPHSCTISCLDEVLLQNDGLVVEDPMNGPRGHLISLPLPTFGGI